MLIIKSSISLGDSFLGIRTCSTNVTSRSPFVLNKYSHFTMRLPDDWSSARFSFQLITLFRTPPGLPKISFGTISCDISNSRDSSARGVSMFEYSMSHSPVRAKFKNGVVCIGIYLYSKYFVKYSTL